MVVGKNNPKFEEVHLHLCSKICRTIMSKLTVTHDLKFRGSLQRFLAKTLPLTHRSGKLTYTSKTATPTFTSYHPGRSRSRHSSRLLKSKSGAFVEKCWSGTKPQRSCTKRNERQQSRKVGMQVVLGVGILRNNSFDDSLAEEKDRPLKRTPSNLRKIQHVSFCRILLFLTDDICFFNLPRRKLDFFCSPFLYLGCNLRGHFNLANTTSVETFAEIQ